MLPRLMSTDEGPAEPRLVAYGSRLAAIVLPMVSLLRRSGQCLPSAAHHERTNTSPTSLKSTSR